MNQEIDLQFDKDNFNLVVERMQFLREEVKKYKYDFLTGLKQRKDFDDKLQLMFEGFEFEEKQFAFIMLDVDGLHNVNRLQGYDSGDNLLKTVSHEVSNLFEECDQADVFRISGDEFAVLLGTRLCADRIEDMIKTVNDITFSITIVDGTKCFPSPSSVFKFTDQNLTINKSKKKSERV